MTRHEPPQPSIGRIPTFTAHPLVVGITEDPAPVLVAAAESLAQALGSPRLCFAFADPARYVIEEDPDGSVRHAAIDPDADDDVHERSDSIRTALSSLLHTEGWEFHYLAGRPDRALTHLARAVDASMIMVGTRGPGLAEHLRESLRGPVGTHLSQHQHRPVVTVPLGVVDWQDPVAL